MVLRLCEGQRTTYVMCLTVWKMRGKEEERDREKRKGERRKNKRSWKRKRKRGALEEEEPLLKTSETVSYIYKG